jgi:hypothetical protein
MDATRARRTRDRARQGWYARYRQWRFARYLGFADGLEAPVAMVIAGWPSPKARAEIGLCEGPAPIAMRTACPKSNRYPRSMAVAAR